MTNERQRILGLLDTATRAASGFNTALEAARQEIIGTCEFTPSCKHRSKLPRAAQQRNQVRHHCAELLDQMKIQFHGLPNLSVNEDDIPF